MPDLREKGPGGFNLLIATELSRKLEGKQTTSVEIVRDCLPASPRASRKFEAGLISILKRRFVGRANRDAGPRRSRLHGIPIGIKDIFDTYDMPTAYGSSLYKDHRPTMDTAVVGMMPARRHGDPWKMPNNESQARSPWACAIRTTSTEARACHRAVRRLPLPITWSRWRLARNRKIDDPAPAAFCGVVGYKASPTGADRGGVRHLRPNLDTMGLFARSMRMSRRFVLCSAV